MNAQPIPPTSPQDESSPRHNDMARVSFTIGVVGVLAALVPPFLFLSMICGPIGILGAILGFISLRQMKGKPGLKLDRALAVTGIILGVIPMIILIGIFIYTTANGQMEPLQLP